MRKVLTALLAAALLVGGGIAYAVIASPSQATAQEDSATTDTTEAPADDAETEDQTGSLRETRGHFFGDVLDELVADGVISQDQADAIVEAFEARHEELKAELEARREQLGFRGRRGFGGPGFGLADAFEDGVLDADELAELGEDHPLNDPEGPAAEYLDDGQLTQEELEELFAGGGFRSGFGRGFGHHFGGADDDTNAAEGFFSF